MGFWRRKKEKEKKQKEEEEARKCFLENGSVFLKELITDCNGISNPIRMFSSAQISTATNHFDPKCSYPGLPSNTRYWDIIFYKGIIEGRSYLFKRFSSGCHKDRPHYKDIVLSARVSNHIGFLKLIGCCLEFPYPVLVFEDLEYRSLNNLGSLGSLDAPVVMLPWDVRLKIAKEVATAITYLHTAFPRIIIHRDINPRHVFLDKNGTAKLTDFTFAVTLPEGKTWVEEKVFGTYPYADTICFMTRKLTEYSDVYSFGIFMLVLLLGRKAYNDGTWLLDYVKDLRERGEPIEFGGDSNDMKPGPDENVSRLGTQMLRGDD